MRQRSKDLMKKVGWGYLIPILLFGLLVGVEELFSNLIGSDSFKSLFSTTTIKGHGISSSGPLKIKGPNAPNDASVKEQAADKADKDQNAPQVSKIIEGSIHPGETFSHALKRARVSGNISEEVIKGLSKVLDFRCCRPGDRFSLGLDQKGHLVCASYEKNPLEIYALKKDPSNDTRFMVFQESVEVERRVVRVSGQVQSSLFRAFSKAGVASRVTVAFCDVFASHIDFNTESFPGDRFDLLYEEYYKDGRFLGYGKILAARYLGRSKELEAYYFKPKGQDVGAYFDIQGKDLGTSFLRSPLPVYRLTSGFSSRRLHPILKVYRPHYGVDLAAPVGTPVMAVADGKVVYAGWKRGFGRIVILKHPGGIKTYYGHLYRFGRGIRRGAIVSQKQIIGYVGASGLATGPHLDYRINIHGRFKNPFGIKFRPRKRLKGKDLEEFFKLYHKISPLLKNASDRREIMVETDQLKGVPEGWIG